MDVWCEVTQNGSLIPKQSIPIGVYNEIEGLYDSISEDNLIIMSKRQFLTGIIHLTKDSHYINEKNNFSNNYLGEYKKENYYFIDERDQSSGLNMREMLNLLKESEKFIKLTEIKNRLDQTLFIYPMVENLQKWRSGIHGTHNLDEKHINQILCDICEQMDELIKNHYYLVDLNLSSILVVDKTSKIQAKIFNLHQCFKSDSKSTKNCIESFGKLAHELITGIRVKIIDLNENDWIQKIFNQSNFGDIKKMIIGTKDLLKLK